MKYKMIVRAKGEDVQIEDSIWALTDKGAKRKARRVVDHVNSLITIASIEFVLAELWKGGLKLI